MVIWFEEQGSIGIGGLINIKGLTKGTRASTTGFLRWYSTTGIASSTTGTGWRSTTGSVFYYRNKRASSTNRIGKTPTSNDNEIFGTEGATNGGVWTSLPLGALNFISGTGRHCSGTFPDAGLEG